MDGSSVGITWEDFDLEKSTTRIGGPSFASDGSDFVAMYALQSALQSALSNITLGDVVRTTFVWREDTGIGTPKTDPYQQRETKWLIKCRDTVTAQPVRYEIPCADLSLLDANSPGRMDKSNAAYTNLVAAIEAYALSTAGNSVEVVDVIHVGRNI